MAHIVSKTQPPSGALGDEWFDPTTNKFYKLVAVGGTSVQWLDYTPVVINAGNSIIISANNTITANVSGGGGGGVTLVNNTTENSNTFYLLMSNTTVSGTLSTVNLANSKLFFNPSTGTLNSTIFNSLSDETVKTNRQRITNALSKLSTLGGYTYLMIDSNEPSAGLLAQEVQKVLPEAVKFNPDTGLLSLNYNAVLGLVVESINELEQRITGLENAR
jgi:hypothetical protein